MGEMLSIQNDGPEIVSTNYFETEYARRGVFYLSANAGAFRLLVPPQHESVVNEFLTANEVIISRGPWPEQRRKDAIEILFDDHTDSPYVLHFGMEQVDRVPPKEDASKNWTFSVWIKGANQPVCAYRAKCYYRIVPALPYMEPL